MSGDWEVGNGGKAGQCNIGENAQYNSAAFDSGGDVNISAKY